MGISADTAAMADLPFASSTLMLTTRNVTPSLDHVLAAGRDFDDALLAQRRTLAHVTTDPVNKRLVDAGPAPAAARR